MTKATEQEQADSKAQEARNLAKEAKEQFEQGDKEEGRFLAEAAKDLDEKAANAELTNKSSKPG